MAVLNAQRLCYSGSAAVQWLAVQMKVGHCLVSSGFEVVLPAECARSCGHASCGLCGLAKTTA